MCGAIHLQLSKPLIRNEILPTLGKIPAGGTPPGTELDPLNELLHYFPQTPVLGKLHLVVRAPGKLGYFHADFYIVIRARYPPLSSPIFRLTLSLCQVPRFHP